MKIAYLIPPHSYHFFRQIVPHLAGYGHELVVNPPSLDGFDLAWAAMLPQTPEQGDALRAQHTPLIVWHWDQFSFVDYERHAGWRLLFDLMPSAAEIWCASYETARLLKMSRGYESWTVGSWVDPQDFRPPFSQGEFALYAAPRNAFHKRLEWVELACRRLGLPLKHTYQGPQGLSRAQYCELMKACRCYVMAGFEESNATIPALEAALCGKPVLLSDLPACREEFGDTATYFKPWDFGDLLGKLADVAHGRHPPVAEARERVLRLFDVARVAKRIAIRLEQWEATL